MKLGEAVDPRLAWVRYVHELDDAWSMTSPGPQCRELRRGGERLRIALSERPKVAAVRTFNLSTLVYPSDFAFRGAARLPWPYVMMLHRCLLVQVMAAGTLRNILFNPTDYEAAEATPYFQELLNRFGDANRLKRLVAKQWGPVDQQLEGIGIRPEEIDVIAFDHFHTQDLRPILGSSIPRPDGSYYQARFPNALLLAPRREWNDWDDLHPIQRAWFIEDGKAGVPSDRVVLTDGDLALGDSCLLLRTPGHTTGNQTLFVHAAEGIFGCSENGCSADSWTPHESGIPGLPQTARRFRLDVILNSNTPELMASQYNSMILERTLVDRSPDNPAFVQMFPSSEVMPSALAPGLKPSMIYRRRNSGEIQRRTPAAAE